MKKAAIAALALSLLLLTPSLAMADDNTNASSTPSFRAEVKSDIRGDVNSLRQKSCDARMNTIKTRSESLTNRAQRMENTFADIAKRVEDYYTGKLVPAGITVSNYDSLVSDIAAKKAVVDTTLADANSKASSFSCADLTAVKAEVTAYRVAMQKVITALKDYRTSIKNLIVAVRGAAGQLKPSPSPVATP